MKAKLEKYLGAGRVKENYDLTLKLTIKTKAFARYYFQAKSHEELSAAKKACLALGIQMLLIGGGSNLVILKDTLDYLVVENAYIYRNILKEDDKQVEMLISSGYPMGRLINETIKMGLSGFEYHLGLPGTLGGAIVMNSKWMRPPTYIGSSLVTAHILDNEGNEKIVRRNYFEFDYGYSKLQKTREVFLEGIFKLKREDPLILEKRSRESLKYRQNTQPFGVYSSGCFFKNVPADMKDKLGLPTISAGYLIDKAGLKGLTVGSFYISEKHANFIINKGSGNQKDLIKLLQIIKAKVKEKFNIDLVEEVVII